MRHKYIARGIVICMAVIVILLIVILATPVKAYEGERITTAKQDALDEAADAIEELLKAAKAMHTWIFLNSGDEQAAYDECGLTDEMNSALGYGGQFVAEQPKEEP